MLYFSKSRWFAEVLERPCSAGAPAAFSDEAFFDHIKWIIVIFRLVRDGDATEGRGRPSVRRPGLLTPRLFQRGARETFRVAILVYTRFGRVRGSNRCSASADGECKPMKFMLMGFETPPSWYGYRGSWGSNTTTEQQPSASKRAHRIKGLCAPHGHTVGQQKPRPIKPTLFAFSTTNNNSSCKGIDPSDDRHPNLLRSAIYGVPESKRSRPKTRTYSR